jgi:hypothetical protein
MKSKGGVNISILTVKLLFHPPGVVVQVSDEAKLGKDKRYI